jgi:hypothetical protein
MEDDLPQPPAAASKVLDDDNLLAEILVRVGLPTTLVRAAAVCRRRLHHASDRKFLHRFPRAPPALPPRLPRHRTGLRCDADRRALRADAAQDPGACRRGPPRKLKLPQLPEGQLNMDSHH